MRQDVRELRNSLTKLIQEYRRIKPNLTYNQKKIIENKIKIGKAFVKNPNTPSYINENNELVLGKILLDRCAYCNTDLREIRQPGYPGIPKEAERYCGKSCMVQHSKMKQLKKRYSANSITWGKNEVKLHYNFKCDNPKRKLPHYYSVQLPTRKTRAKNYEG